MNLIEDLQWRYATKRMNGTKVSQDKVNRILDAINLSPTSLGLQAYKVLVIEDQALKEKIFAEACQQPQTKECSHLLVFAPYTSFSEEQVSDFIEMTVSARSLDQEWAAKYTQTINYFLNKNKEQVLPWLTHQVYIALGTACVAAANERVDSVPIEGFDRAKLDQILGLQEKGLTSAVLLPLGYRDTENDPLSSAIKVRKNIKDLVIRL